MTNKLVSAAEKIINAKKRKESVIVFTGAGVSISSGVPSFTTSKVLKRAMGPKTWFLRNMIRRPLDYLRDAQLFQKRMLSAHPNMGHYAIAWLIKREYARTIITGNTDGLHEKTIGIKQLATYTESGGKFMDLFAPESQKKNLGIARELVSKAGVMIVSGWSYDEHKLIKLAKKRNTKIIEISPKRKFAGRKDIFLPGFSQVVFPELQREIYMLDR